MPAVTETSREETIEGNHRVVYGYLASVDSGDTWDSRLKVITSAQANAETGAAVGMTISGGTITFVNAGTLVVRVRAVGV